MLACINYLYIHDLTGSNIQDIFVHDYLLYTRVRVMKKWLRELLDEFLPSVESLRDTPSDRAAAQRWADWMKGKWVERGLVELKQQKVPMNDTRNAIKALDPSHVALEYMNFTPEEWTIVNEPLEQRVADRNENIQLIDDPQAIVDKATELLDSREWSEVAAGLAVLTGRRSSELLHTANFTYKTAFSVIFTGALKRRGEPVTLRFEIPTLASADKVIAALSKVRAYVDTEGMDNRQVNDKYGPGVVKACDRHFCELVPHREGRDNLYTHLFRCIYARIATHFYAPPTLSDIEYMATIMGHFQILDAKNPTLKRSLVSSRHYNDYRIGDGRGNIDGRQGIKLGLPGVEVIEVFRKQQNMSDRPEVNSVFSIPCTPVLQPASPTLTVENMATKKEFLDRSRSPNQIDGEDEINTELLPGTQPEQSTSSSSDGVADRVESDRFVEIAASLLLGTKASEILAGLMAVTGRNAAELVKSGIFHHTGEEHFLRFSKQLATQQEDLITLVSASSVLKAIDTLRNHPFVCSEQLNYASPKDIESKMRLHTERTIKRAWKGVIKPLNYQGLMAAYSQRSERRQIADLSIPDVSGTSEPSVGSSHPMRAGREKSSSIRCFTSDKERILALGNQLGCSDRSQTIRTLVDLGEWAKALAQSLGVEPQPMALEAKLQSLLGEKPCELRRVDRSVSPNAPATPVHEGATPELVEPATVGLAGLSQYQTCTPEVEPTALRESVVADNRSSGATGAGVVAEPSVPEKPAPESVPGGVELDRAWEKIDRLVEAVTVLATALSHSVQPTVQTGQLNQVVQPRIPKVKKQSKDAVTIHEAAVDGNPGDSGRFSGSQPPERTGESADQKAYRALLAIMEFNQAPGRIHDQKWAINQTSLQQLTGCHRDVIKRVLAQHQAEIDRHNHQHGLGKSHNISKGRAGLKINEQIHW